VTWTFVTLKEIKDATHFQKMAFTITTPRRIANIDLSDDIAMKGGVETGETGETSESWMQSLAPSNLPVLVGQALSHMKRLPASLFGSRAI
jgi:hypothetical protein